MSCMMVAGVLDDLDIEEKYLAEMLGTCIVDSHS